MLAATLLGAAEMNATAQVRILPLGDSDTSSFAPHSSYRYWLWHRLVDAGFNVDFVGSQHSVVGGVPANADFDQDHEGHPGWATPDVLENINSIAAATQPDIVLIDLGANDVISGVPLETTTENFILIIQRLRAVNPQVTILLAQTPPFEGQDKVAMRLLRRAIRSVAKRENTRESRVYVVNLFGGFSVKKDTFDGMHPDESGEQKIAKRFFKVLRRVLRRLR